MIDDKIKLIGNTPLIRLDDKSFKIYGKMEAYNASGSIKDRPALYMVLDAEEKGLIKRNNDDTIITATSGNTGISLAFIGSILKYNVIITMPESMSIERRKVIESYGAKIILTAAKEGMTGAVNKAVELSNEIKNSVLIDQFSNESNVLSHIKTTGPEILKDLGKAPDMIVAGFGTGGTITGLAKYFKEYGTRIIAVEPDSSPLVTKGIAGPHKIQGIGANFIPSILDLDLIDEVYTVKDDDAIRCSKLLSMEGLFVGISSGANYSAAMDIIKRDALEDKDVVIILPDSRDRYLSIL